MRKLTKIVAYLIGIFFLISGIANNNVPMIIIAICYFIFSFFNLGCLKHNCSLDDNKTY